MTRLIVDKDSYNKIVTSRMIIVATIITVDEQTLKENKWKKKMILEKILTLE